MSVPEGPVVAARRLAGQLARRRVPLGRGTASIVLPGVPGLRGRPAVVAGSVARARCPGKVAPRPTANLTQAVHAPKGSWSTPARAEPGAQRRERASDAWGS